VARKPAARSRLAGPLLVTDEQTAREADAGTATSNRREVPRIQAYQRGGPGLYSDGDGQTGLSLDSPSL